MVVVFFKRGGLYVYFPHKRVYNKEISISLSACGGIRTLSSTISYLWLKLPHFNGIYPSGVKCTWLVKRTDGLAIWVMPIRRDYWTVCSNYTMQAWSPNHHSTSAVDLCLGRPNYNWAVKFNSQVVVSFAVRPNIERPIRPNVSLKVSSEFCDARF